MRVVSRALKHGSPNFSHNCNDRGIRLAKLKIIKVQLLWACLVLPKSAFILRLVLHLLENPDLGLDPAILLNIINTKII